MLSATELSFLFHTFHSHFKPIKALNPLVFIAMNKLTHVPFYLFETKANMSPEAISDVGFVIL